MAYMSQENKKALAPQIKAILKKYGMKGTISVNNYSTLVVTIQSGRLDVIGNYRDRETEKGKFDRNYMSVNEYWLDDHYDGGVLAFLTELKTAMNATPDGTIANYNNSDIMTDYFDVGWYITINIGKWDKPYQLIAE